jgi:virulence-associated protein VagC
MTERHASLFRNGRNQAVRISRELELEGTEVMIRKEATASSSCPSERTGSSICWPVGIH